MSNNTHPQSDSGGGFLALVVLAFVFYTLYRLPDLMLAMDAWAGITP